MDGPNTRLRLRVSPGAAHSEVVGQHGDAWKLRVDAPPESGKATRAVIELLAKTLQIPRNRITIVAGLGSRDKIVVVEGLSPGSAETRMGSPVTAR